MGIQEGSDEGWGVYQKSKTLFHIFVSISLNILCFLCLGSLGISYDVSFSSTLIHIKMSEHITTLENKEVCVGLTTVKGKLTLKKKLWTQESDKDTWSGQCHGTFWFIHFLYRSANLPKSKGGTLRQNWVHVYYQGTEKITKLRFGTLSRLREGLS